jgi:ketoreductase
MNSRVALITGASGGIGAVISQHLAIRHRVILASSSQERIEQAASDLRSACPTATVLPVTMDVSQPETVQNAVDAGLREFGKIDVLVNCAGIAGGGRTVDFPDRDWDNIINVNLSGVFHVTKAVLASSGMLERGWGRIINIASTGGKQGVVFAAAYSASKHGVVGFTKSLGLELAKSGVTVNAICPGFVETDMAVHARARYAEIWHCSVQTAKERIETRIPIGRYVQPSEIVGLVEYLASDGSAAVLAQAFNICGGLGNY